MLRPKTSKKLSKTVQSIGYSIILMATIKLGDEN